MKTWLNVQWFQKISSGKYIVACQTHPDLVKQCHFSWYHVNFSFCLSVYSPPFLRAKGFYGCWVSAQVVGFTGDPAPLARDNI